VKLRETTERCKSQDKVWTPHFKVVGWGGGEGGEITCQRNDQCSAATKQRMKFEQKRDITAAALMCKQSIHTSTKSE
jgi:hypothetical protein